MGEMSSVPGFIGPPPLWQEAPRPVIGLTYARPGTARVTRPGIWIAVGVLSVLIGLVSMGVNAIAFMAAREVYRISVKSAAATAVSAARFTPAGPVTLAPVNVV